MSFRTGRISTLTALAAALAMAAPPAAAADLPLGGAPALHAASEGTVLGNYRDRRHRHYRHRGRDRGIDAGDVIGGVVILGAIAAIASAASRNRDSDRDGGYRYDRRPVPEQARYPDRQQPRGLSRAEEMCVDQVERDRGRVASVDGSARDPQGWLVSGELERGGVFSCRIGNDGRITDIRIDYDAAGSSTVYDDRQYDGDTYARARAEQRSQGSGVPSYDDVYEREAEPAYPDGPWPGEEEYSRY